MTRRQFVALFTALPLVRTSVQRLTQPINLRITGITTFEACGVRDYVQSNGFESMADVLQRSAIKLRGRGPCPSGPDGDIGPPGEGACRIWDNADA